MQPLEEVRVPWFPPAKTQLSFHCQGEPARLTESASERQGILFLKVHVVPNARDAGVVKIDLDTLEVRVDARAERGRANKRLLELVSEYLGVPRSKVMLVAGARSRDKTILVVP